MKKCKEKYKDLFNTNLDDTNIKEDLKDLLEDDCFKRYLIDTITSNNNQ